MEWLITFISKFGCLIVRPEIFVLVRNVSKVVQIHIILLFDQFPYCLHWRVHKELITKQLKWNNYFYIPWVTGLIKSYKQVKFALWYNNIFYSLLRMKCGLLNLLVLLHEENKLMSNIFLNSIFEFYLL